MTALERAVLAERDDAQAAVLSRFFRTGPGEYGEGDRFLGVKVPVVRRIVRNPEKKPSFRELESCVASKWHEVRLAGFLALVRRFSRSRDEEERKRCFDFYLAHADRANNWDLVDLTCHEIVGAWLADKDRSVLRELARKGRSLWERRIAIVSTMHFLRRGELDDTYEIAEILLDSEEPPHDLLQKASGWLLREAGKRDEKRLKRWLRGRVSTLPRTALRYAIEKFPAAERKRWLSLS